LAEVFQADIFSRPRYLQRTIPGAQEWVLAPAVEKYTAIEKWTVAVVESDNFGAGSIDLLIGVEKRRDYRPCLILLLILFGSFLPVCY
jgi:hypothetical protein